jgi:DNA-directed RNA polymerase subunit RPC12/RpoP
LIMQKGCPGSSNVKIPELELLECPKCGGEVEFFTRDKKSNCTECGQTVMREANPSCLDWCPMAAECFPGFKKDEAT